MLTAHFPPPLSTLSRAFPSLSAMAAVLVDVRSYESLELGFVVFVEGNALDIVLIRWVLYGKQL